MKQQTPLGGACNLLNCSPPQPPRRLVVASVSEEKKNTRRVLRVPGGCLSTSQSIYSIVPRFETCPVLPGGTKHGRDSSSRTHDDSFHVPSEGRERNGKREMDVTRALHPTISHQTCPHQCILNSESIFAGGQEAYEVGQGP